MIVVKRNHGYGVNRQYIQGKGFVDSLTSSLKSIGSYVSQNKDLIAKPLLGAVGNLAATGLTEGTKALMNHIVSRDRETSNVNKLDAKSIAILQNIIGESDIIGSGIKKF